MKQYDFVNMTNARLGIDFIVVSKVAIDKDYMPSLYEEGMDMSSLDSIITTPYDEELVEFSYHMKNHKIDFDLAVTLGLGVIQGTDGIQYLYNADLAEDDHRIHDEILRIGIYYQIAHPGYDDVQLDRFFHTKGGEEYIRSLMFILSEEPISKLKSIFASKRGGDNVKKIK